MTESQFVDPSNKKAPEDAEEMQFPNTGEFVTDEDGETMPSIRGNGIASNLINVQKAKLNEERKQGPAPDQNQGQEQEQEGPFDKFRQTAFHKIVTELWGQPQIADYMAVRLAQYMDLESAEKTKNGFKVKTQDGNTVNWGITQNSDGSLSEAITAKKRKFTQNTADAMIAMSLVHGWREIYVDGKQEHKEMLWLSVQRAAMAEQREFERQQRDGERPADEKYIPPMVKNFEPPEDSAVYQIWLKERAEFEAEREEFRNPATVLPAPKQLEAPAPDAAKSDTKAPDAVKPEGTTPEAATPAQPGAAAPAPTEAKAPDAAPAEGEKTDAKAPDAAKPKATAPEKDAPAAAAVDDGIQAKNPAFEARHPRDKDGHFVSPETGKHKPITKRAKGEASKEFNEKAPRSEKPVAAVKATRDKAPPAQRHEGKAPPPT